MQKSRLFLVTLGALTLGTVARPSEAAEAERAASAVAPAAER